MLRSHVFSGSCACCACTYRNEVMSTDHAFEDRTAVLFLNAILIATQVKVFDKDLLLSGSKILADQPCLMWASKQHSDWQTGSYQSFWSTRFSSINLCSTMKSCSWMRPHVSGVIRIFLEKTPYTKGTRERKHK